MSQPPYQPYPGEPGPEEGYQPPAAPGSYPPPGQGSYPPPPGQSSYPPPPGQSSYPPPPGQGSYPQPGQGSYPPPPGSYPPPPDHGSYQPPADHGSYPPPGQGSYPPGSYPGQNAPQYGMGPAPKKKSSALKIVLIVVGVVALLCVAGVVVTFVAAKDKVEQVVDASKITVVEPETLGGRPKADDPTLQSSVNGLDAVMSNIPGATGSVGAIYGDVQNQDIVMVAAASSINGSAQDRFDSFNSGLDSSGGFKIENMTDTDPGPLGGIAKCGDTDTAGVPMAVCVWSDNGSVGMLTMMFKEKADLEKEFITLRGEVEKKA
ncbi:hypothetical protein [Actinoplanes sp. NPDC049599]|uniref:hypothetical protein n=1 Tax=Actinoplanes sp. NPDC049599 TaxID=3363903 RepID=UPI0037ADBAA8